MPFVIGQYIALSNNHTCKGVEGVFRDICDDLKGEYPKEFKFTGWHPHCRCHVVLNTGMSRHNVFLSKETMLRDCFTHETGHTVHDQIHGGLNGSFFRQKKFNVSDATVLDEELKALWKKHKKAGGGWLSEYGLSSHKEFMSESFVLYHHAPKTLPADVKAWFDLLHEYSQTGKLPAREKMPSVAYKPEKKIRKKAKVSVSSSNAVLVPKTQEELEARKRLHRKLDEDPEYMDVHFNEGNGGLKATHINNHPCNPEKDKKYFGDTISGRELEKECQNEIYRMGGIAILQREKIILPTGEMGSCLDILINDKLMDIRSITEHTDSYLNALRKKEKQLAKYNLQQGTNHNSLCLYFHDPSMFDNSIMQETIKDFLELEFRIKGTMYKPSDNLQRVICVIKGNQYPLEYIIKE